MISYQHYLAQLADGPEVLLLIPNCRHLGNRYLGSLQMLRGIVNCRCAVHLLLRGAACHALHELTC